MGIKASAPLPEQSEINCWGSWIRELSWAMPGEKISCGLMFSARTMGYRVASSGFECEPEHSMGIHRMIVDNYLVCYVVDPGVVTVTDVLYGASDVHKRLQERRNT